MPGDHTGGGADHRAGGRCCTDHSGEGQVFLRHGLKHSFERCAPDSRRIRQVKESNGKCAKTAQK